MQHAGFAFCHGGYAAATHHQGLPDIGVVGLAEIAESLRRVTNVARTPVVVDCDTAYVAIPVVKRTEAAGAAAIQIEDQAFPKKCGILRVSRSLIVMRWS